MEFPNPNLSDLNILLVDNDPNSMEKIKSFLEQENDEFNVKTVDSGEKAIKKLSKDFDIIVSEYQIPDLSGLDLLKKAKNVYNIPFIFFTGEKRKESAKKAFDNGADRYIHREDDLDTELEFLANGIKKEVHYHRNEKIRKNRRNELVRLTDNIPGLAYRCLNDENWTMKFLSDGVKDLTGYESNDLLNNKNLSYNDIVHPEDRDRVQNEIDKALDRGEKFRVSYRIRTANNNVKWVWEQGSGVDVNGKTILEGIIIDISGRKDIEKRLKHINSLLKSIKNINQLISKKKDINTIINQTKEILNKTRDYEKVSIIRGDNKQEQPELDEISGETKNKILNIIEENEGIKILNDKPEIDTVIIPIKNRIELGHLIIRSRKKIKNEELKLLEEITKDLVHAQEKITIRDKLKRSKEKYHSLFINMNSGVATHEMIYDESGEAIDYRIKDVNPKFEEIIGIKKDFATGALASNIYRPNTPPYLDTYQEVIESNESKTFERYYEPLDKHFLISIFTIGEKEFATVFYDITDRVKSKKKLKKERNRFKKLTETSPIGITVVNSNGEITFANTEAEKTLGLERDQITDRTYNDPDWEITDYEGNVFPDEKLPFKQVKRKKKTVYDIKHTIRNPDGEVKYLKINSSPIFNEYGDIEKVVNTIEDVTEQKKSEEKIKNLNKLLRSIRDINQLITKADNLDHLMNKATEILNESRGYLNTSIFFIDDNKIDLFSNSGVHEDRNWKANLNGEKVPEIFKKAIKNKEPIKNLEPENYSWDCFLSEETHPIVTVPMTYDGKVLGILSICFSKDRNIEDEDVKLLEETSNDLAYAINKIETDKKLIESETRFRKFFDRSPNALVIVDSDDNIINFNSRFEELFEYREEEIKGENINDVLAPNRLLDEAYKLKNKAKEGFQKFETVREGKNGEIPVSISSIPITINEEEYIIASYEDISDRKEVEKELKASRDRYKSLFENSPVVVWEEDFSEVKSYLENLKREVDSLEKYLQENPDEVKKIARKVRVIDVNKTALDYYGCKSKEKIINNREEMFTDEAYDAFREELLKIAEGETDIENESMVKTFDDEKKYELLHISIPDKYSNTYERAYLSIVDITKRKEARQELKEREKRLNNAINKSPFPMMILDEDGEVIRINEAWEDISGYSHDDIPTIYDWISKAYDEEGERVKREIKELFERYERVDEGEFTIETKEGEKRNWYFSSAPLGKLPSGKKLIISMAKDITDRKNAERERKFVNSMLRQDIQTKAQLTTGYLQLLRDCELTEQCSKYVKKGLESGLKQIDLINRVQKLRETEVEEPYQIDLNQEIKEIIKEQRNEIKKIDTEKTIKYKRNHESYVLGTSLLKELLINLIKLGIEDKECDQIKIQTVEKDQEVLIKTKADTRIILPETKEKIRKNGYSGETTGFGGLRFYMIKRIIDMLDTEIEIETSPENQTQFILHLKKAKNKEKKN